MNCIVGVTPFAGVWIEIYLSAFLLFQTLVTPFAGVWIEIKLFGVNRTKSLSLPLRECGLK